MLKRVWYYVTRKKLKSLLMALVLFGISAALLSGIAIKRAVEVSKEKLYKDIGAGFTVSNNLQYNLGMSNGGGNIPRAMLEEIGSLKEIKDFVWRMKGIAELGNAEMLELPGESAMYEGFPSNVVDFMGVSKSALDSKFRSGTLQLTQGRHLEESDKYKAMVHEDFAKANHLKPGDTLKMKASRYDLNHTTPSSKTIEAEVVGLFAGKNVLPPNVREELYENIIMTDLATVKTLYHYTEETEIYQDAVFFAKNPGELEKLMKAVYKLPLDWKNYQAVENGSEYAAITTSVEGMNQMTKTMMAGAVITGAAVVTLLLFLWIHGRTKETGILLALGISKKEILLQYFLELLVIGAVSLTLAFFAGRQMAQSIGDSFLQKSSQKAVEAVHQEANGMLGADAETSGAVRTLEHLEVQIGFEDMAALCVFMVIVIFVSVCASFVPVMRRKPREILTQMS